MLSMLEGLNGLVIFLKSQGESVRLPVAIYSDSSPRSWLGFEAERRSSSSVSFLS